MRRSVQSLTDVIHFGAAGHIADLIVRAPQRAAVLMSTFVVRFTCAEILKSHGRPVYPLPISFPRQVIRPQPVRLLEASRPQLNFSHYGTDSRQLICIGDRDQIPTPLIAVDLSIGPLNPLLIDFIGEARGEDKASFTFANVRLTIFATDVVPLFVGSDGCAVFFLVVRPAQVPVSPLDETVVAPLPVAGFGLVSQPNEVLPILIEF